MNFVVICFFKTGLFGLHKTPKTRKRETRVSIIGRSAFNSSIVLLHCPFVSLSIHELSLGSPINFKLSKIQFSLHMQFQTDKFKLFLHLSIQFLLEICDRIRREMAAPNRIERAHQMYREGRYEEALGFYTEAIAMAKTNPQKIALHSNRAACFLKLHDFKKVTSLPRSPLNLLLVLWFGKRFSMLCKVSESFNFSFYFV